MLNDSLKADCYPLQAGENHLIVGVGRPDYPDHITALQRAFNKKVAYHNALTVSEMGTMRTLCQQALNTL